MERRLIRHGFILIAVALLSGLVIPAAKIPRLALSAHTIGGMSGILLIVVALVWQRFNLTDRQRRTKYWAWLYSSYVNWLAILTLK
jgi:hydroxylaminobenzene mutase